MSDERVRDLERRWRASGTVADEAAYLVERMRVGEVAPEKALASAKLGHPAALVALGKTGEWLKRQRLDDTLSDFGRQSLSRVMLIILERFCLELGFTQATPHLIEELMKAVRAWLANPTPELAARVGHEGGVCAREAMQLNEHGLVVADTPGLLGRLLQLAGLLGQNIYEDGDAHYDIELYTFLFEIRDEYPCLQDDRIRALLLEWLVPWLLGYSDPLNIGAPKAGSS